MPGRGIALFRDKTGLAECVADCPSGYYRIVDGEPTCVDECGTSEPRLRNDSITASERTFQCGMAPELLRTEAQLESTEISRLRASCNGNEFNDNGKCKDVCQSPRPLYREDHTCMSGKCSDARLYLFKSG